MKKVNFLDLKLQYAQLQTKIDAAIKKVLLDADFVKGKSVTEFENNFAHYLQAQEVIGVGNGTDALELAIAALQLPMDSEIIVPANSFVASAEAVSNKGLKVVFCDCNQTNYTLDLNDLETKITPRTRAIMAVHLYGHPCDMEGIKKIIASRDIYLIEDCAQAHGSKYNDMKVGALGDIAAFSFYPGKNLGAYGDGGAVVTNERELAERVRMLANHGRSGKYNHQFIGRNSRLDTLQAAILNVKLPYLDDWLKTRKTIAQTYRQHLLSSELFLPQEAENVWQAYHLFVIRLKNVLKEGMDTRENLRQFLKTKGIDTGIHYPIALPDLTAYRQINDVDKLNQPNALEPQFDNASNFATQILSIPIGEHMQVEDALYISENINNFFTTK